jgi:succinate dehydrogenase/fumarate reductase flavoprotein subunit
MPQNGELYGTYDFPGNTGDGYLLGYRAGAKLTSMEYTMCYVILKDVETPGTAMMIEKGARIIDAAGNALFEEGFYDLSEVNRIQNSPSGPLRLRLSHLPADKIEEIEHLIFTLERPSCERFLKGRNVDMRKSDVELATTELFLCGGHGQAGLAVDETAATTVAGLYGAGDTAPLGRGYLTGAFVFGQLAAENGSEFAKDRGLPVPEERGFLKFMEKLEGYQGQQYNPVPVRDLEFKLRKTINDYLMPPKNEYKLNLLLEHIARFRKDLKSQVRVETQRNLNETLEVENILASAYLSAIASLERKESRWGFWHQRGDYPEKDDSNWLKHIDLQINPNAQEPEISYRTPRRIQEIGDFA